MKLLIIYTIEAGNVQKSKEVTGGARAVFWKSTLPSVRKGLGSITSGGGNPKFFR